jgi:hypothetical protein
MPPAKPERKMASRLPSCLGIEHRRRGLKRRRGQEGEDDVRPELVSSLRADDLGPGAHSLLSLKEHGLATTQDMSIKFDDTVVTIIQY